MFLLEANEETKLPLGVVIGASCGGGFVICLLTVYLIRRYKRRGTRSPRRVSDSMPAEVAFPNPEKYEMKDTTPHEDIIRCEETGIFNKALLE